MANQPKWKMVGQIGDTDPLTYGGGFVFADTTGVYPPEVEWVDEPCDDIDLDDKNARWTAYRVVLEPMKWMQSSDDLQVYLVGKSVQRDWEQHATMRNRQEWWMKDIESIACREDGVVGFIDNITSDDPMRLAMAYWDIASHWGWAELDHYPNQRTKLEAHRRYGNYLRRKRK